MYGCGVDVTNQPDLKEIERRAYMSYHQDGLLDIFAGLYVLGFGLGLFMDVVWDFGMGVIILPGGFIAVAVSIWIAAKRRITMPRIGFVNFGTRGATKLTAIFIGTMVAGLGAFFAFTLFQGGPSPWRDVIFQNGLIIIGIGSFGCLRPLRVFNGT